MSEAARLVAAAILVAGTNANKEAKVLTLDEYIAVQDNLYLAEQLVDNANFPSEWLPDEEGE